MSWFVKLMAQLFTLLRNPFPRTEALRKARTGEMKDNETMYPRAFHYHRAGSLKEAATMLAQLGDDAKLLAGGQSLIPLMKFRFANPDSFR